MTLPQRTPARLAELTRDAGAIRQPANDDTPIWLEAVDAEVRTDLRAALRAIVAGALAGLAVVGCIVLVQFIILWRP